MTTLLQQGARRCDARCYGASGPDCDCCCGGSNHGKGFARALSLTRARPPVAGLKKTAASAQLSLPWGESDDSGFTFHAERAILPPTGDRDMSNVFTKINEARGPSLAEEFLGKFEVEVETNFNLLSGRYITTRKDGADFTRAQLDWIGAFMAGFDACERVVVDG